MKRFRISFLAVIALLAIGLTAATKAESNKIAKFEDVENCYRNLVVVCPTPGSLIFESTNCPPESILGSAVADPDETNDFSELEECIGFEKFCCAKLRALEVSPCTGASTIPLFIDENGITQQNKYAVIVDIACKEL